MTAARRYDRFRGRLMIPIRDARGRVIAFGGRILGAGEPKYLNSPDTPLFDKGRTLYNLDRAGPASRTAKRLIVVEGYMDVIAPRPRRHRRGRRAQRHRGHRGPARADVAARPRRRSSASTATARAGRPRSAPPLRALPHIGARAHACASSSCPPGQDPDDVVRSGGTRGVRGLLAKPEPLDERLWRHELEAEPLTTPEARAGLRQRLIDHAQAIGDPALRRLYRDQWLRRFETEIAPQRRNSAAAASSAGTAASRPAA